MHYIIQEDVFRESNYKNLVSTIHKLGLPYTIVRIFPFIDKIVDVKNIPDFPYDVDKLPDINVSSENVFCFGAVKLARVASKFSWYPGSLLNSNHDFSVYKNHYDLLLLYPKCKTNEEFQVLLINKIQSVITKYVSSDLIVEYTIRVETELDLSTRRNYIIDRILSDTIIEIEPIILEIYYKTRFSDIKNIQVCVKTI
jgi:hypothetical protein